MLLVIDVGNTNIVLGVYRNDELMCHWRIATVKERTVDEYAIVLKNLFDLASMTFSQLSAVIISCVVPPMLDNLERLSQHYFKQTPLVVGPGIRTGMPIQYDNPREVGADRIVNAVAAYEKWRCAMIVVDFGTATTFDVISAAGTYLGGAIAPGVGISSEALFARASKLPRVEFSRPAQIIARNTVNSMQAGIFYGYVGLVEGIVSRMQAEAGIPLKVIATGGLAETISKGCEVVDSVAPWLTLEGLKILYQRNTPAALSSEAGRIKGS